MSLKLYCGYINVYKRKHQLPNIAIKLNNIITPYESPSRHKDGILTPQEEPSIWKVHGVFQA
jgi:hypothetical protein